jgi:hypothetical protein
MLRQAQHEESELLEILNNALTLSLSKGEGERSRKEYAQ